MDAKPNPFAAPNAAVADVPAPGADTAQLERIAAGQRFIIFALLGQVVAYALTGALGGLGVVVAVIALLVAVIGVVRLAGALGSSIVLRVILCVLMLIPLVSLLVLASLSARATKRLLAGGWKVGLLGARRPA